MVQCDEFKFWVWKRKCGTLRHIVKYESGKKMAATIANNLKDAVNLTPHAIVVVDDDGKEVLNIPASGTVARLIAASQTVAKVSIGSDVFVPVVIDTTGDGHNHYSDCDLGAKSSSANIIVSKMVADAIWETMPAGKTLWVPDTGPGSVVRDAAGAVVGVKRMLLYGTPL